MQAKHEGIGLDSDVMEDSSGGRVAGVARLELSDSLRQRAATALNGLKWVLVMEVDG